jgi:bleomycin hydrolase
MYQIEDIKMSDETYNSNNGISLDFIDNCKENFNNNRANVIARNVVVSVGSLLSTVDSNELNKISHIFLNTVKKPNLKATNQGQSGRCWLFSGVNTFRHSLIEALRLKEFEFSVTYLFFWDKLERANTYLNWFLTNDKYKPGDREFDFMLKEFYSDGGYYNFFLNLVKKYGLIPKHAMQESFHSDYTNDMNQILVDILHNGAYQLYESKRKSKHNIRLLLNNFVQQIYNTLVKFLGEPPTKFNWNYTDQEENSNIINNLTPLKFYKMVLPDVNLDDFIVLCNMPPLDPSFTHPSFTPPSDAHRAGQHPIYIKFNELYQIKYTNNMIDGKFSVILNLHINELLKYTTKSILAGFPVWFASDVGQDFNPIESTLDDKLMDTESMFGNTIQNLNKGQRMLFKNVEGTHAMNFVGVNVDHNNKAINFSVENSWGMIDEEVPGLDGFLNMSVSWFKKYVTQVVIHKNFLSRVTKKLLNKTPIIVDPWDTCAPAKITGKNPSIHWEKMKKNNL